MRELLLKKALVCLMVLVLAQAMLVSEFALVNRGGQSGKSGPCVLSFDVCGHGHSAGAFGGADLLAAVPQSSLFIPSFDKSFPPIPEQAVATAEPGETKKPPKA